MRGFLVLQLIVWTVLPTLCSSNAPLDVIEGYAWGREWLLGTYKHPPMQAWLLEIFAEATGRAAWAPYLLSQLCITAALAAVWDAGRRIMGETRALVGTLLLEGIIYYNLTSPEFNPNVLQIAFWALACWAFYRAVKEDELWQWSLLGVFSAAGLYSKYSTALLIGVFIVMTVLRPEARRCLKRPGPYLALLLALALFAPHIVWLVENDFLPFVYVRERLAATGPATHFPVPRFIPPSLLSPVIFLFAQLLAMLPAVMMFMTVDGRDRGTAPEKRIPNFDRVFLAAVTFTPLLLTLGMALVFGFRVHDMWGAPFFNFLGLWAVAKIYPSGIRVRLRFVAAWIVVFAGIAAAFVGTAVLSPYFSEKPLRTDYPGKTLSRQITEAWHARYNAPLEYVVGDTWLAGNVAFYAAERPHVFINADPLASGWIDQADLRQKGAVLVWNEINKSERNQIREQAMFRTFPDAEIQQPLEIHLKRADAPPVIIGWAIVPPQK